MERLNQINAYWWKGFNTLCTNFGDMLSPKVISFLTGNDNIVHSFTKCDQRIVAIGSLLGNMNKLYETDILWGTGAMFETPMDISKIDKNITVTAVRGPKTKKFLENIGIFCPSIYGDPGILAPVIYNIKKTKVLYKYGIILHMKDYEQCYKKIILSLIKNNQCNNILFIDPTAKIENVLECITMCDTIISSSLHGIIVSEALGIKCIWMECSNNVEGNGFKFYDYYLGTHRSENEVTKLDWKTNIKIPAKICFTPKPKYDIKSLLSAFPLKISKDAKQKIIDYFGV